MEQRRFGNSGLSVSVLSFGSMTIGGRDRFGKMGNLGVADRSAGARRSGTRVIADDGPRASVSSSDLAISFGLDLRGDRL